MKKYHSVLGFMVLALLLGSLGMASAQIESDADFAWDMYSGQGIELQMLAIQGPWITAVEPRIAEFEAATGIDVTLEVLPEAQAWDKVRIEMQAGSPNIDVFLNQTSRFGVEFTANGWLVNLDDYLANADLTHPEFDYEEDFLGYSKDAVRFDDQTIAIPTDRVLGTVLTYRTDILEQYGIEVPTTLEELQAAAIQIWEESGGDIAGFVNRGKGAEATSHFKYILYEYGGSWNEPDGTLSINTPEALAAFDWYGTTLRESGSEAAVAFGFAETTNEFLTGNAAMTLELGVNPGNVADETASSVAGLVSWAAMPAGPASEQARSTEPCVQAPPFGLSISGFSEQPDASWLLVQWLTSKEAQLDYLQAGRVAARQSAWDSPEFAESITEAAAPYWEAQAVASQYCYPTPGHGPDSIRDVTRARDVIGQVVTTAILGGDIEGAANMAQEELEALRAREQA